MQKCLCDHGAVMWSCSKTAWFFPSRKYELVLSNFFVCVLIKLMFCDFGSASADYNCLLLFASSWTVGEKCWPNCYYSLSLEKKMLCSTNNSVNQVTLFFLFLFKVTPGLSLFIINLETSETKGWCGGAGSRFNASELQDLGLILGLCYYQSGVSHVLFMSMCVSFYISKTHRWTGKFNSF